MKSKEKSTLCVHSGSTKDQITKGVNTPIYTSTAFGYLNQNEQLYPRYFNTINQKAVVQKICDLEHAEAGLLFSSGMAAISTGLLALLQKGDHIIFQKEIYGGTQHLAVNEFPKFGITYSIAKGNSLADLEREIKPETKIIYVETPSNPLLSITDLEAVANLAKTKNILTFIDNTFASPINQNPIDWGIDIVMHSGTKYLGGHSDICCGALLASKDLVQKITKSAWNFGGTMDSQTCYLLERSIKTLYLRVSKQNENALAIANYLENQANINKVFYPGLASHPNHKIAARQMKGFGGMVSFKLDDTDSEIFLNNLKLITPALSLGGVESGICQPSRTSHSKISQAERDELGISDKLMRLSVGIEDVEELIADIEYALQRASVEVLQN